MEEEKEYIEHITLVNIARNILKHPSDINNFEEFIHSGGMFKISDNHDVYAEYDIYENSIKIGNHVIEDMEKSHGERVFAIVLGHELVHFKGYENFFNNFSEYAEKEMKGDFFQIYEMVPEVSAFYHEIVTAYETGIKQWESLKKVTRTSLRPIEKILRNKFKIKAGREIPKEYLPVVADFALIAFAYNASNYSKKGVKTGYQKSLAENLYERIKMSFFSLLFKKDDGFSIPTKEFLNTFELPATLDDKTISDLLLFDRDYLNAKEKLVFPIYDVKFSKTNKDDEKKIGRDLINNLKKQSHILAEVSKTR